MTIKVKTQPFELTHEWAPPGAVPDLPVEADRATWGRWKLALGPFVLSQGADADGQLHDTLEAPLYPLAEWIVLNWWALLADARPGTMISQLRVAYANGVGDQRGVWHVRPRPHTLRAGSGGYVTPDVLIVPEGTQTRVTWMPDHASTPKFLGRASAVVRTDEFVGQITAFVDAVVRRLDDQGVSGTPLQERWITITTADQGEVAFSRLAAQLAVDPYTEAGPYEHDILAAARELPAHLVFDFFNGVGRNRLPDRVDWLGQARRAASSVRARPSRPAAALAELRELVADLAQEYRSPGRTGDPWDIGAEAAIRVRRWAGLADTEPFYPEAFMAWDVVDTPYLDRGLVAFGTRAGATGPALVGTRKFTRFPRRFLQARALWHLIAGEEDEFLIVASHTDRQHVARGFALELLAPANGIARQLGEPGHLVTSEDVEQIADDYGCGNIVVEHQLDNRVTQPDFAWPPDEAAVAENALRGEEGEKTFPFPPGPRGTVPPEYAQLRATHPVARVTLADGAGIVLVTKYEDVRRVLTDPLFSRHRAAVLPGKGLGRSQGTGIVDLDPPEHDRLRAPVVKAFDIGRVHRWRARIEQIAAEALAGLPTDEPADLVAGYTAPLAGRVTAELLGVTGDGWRQLTGDVEGMLTGTADSSAGERTRATLAAVLEARRREPADDVPSALLAAALTDDDRLLLLQGLVVSGFIGVRDLLARHLFAVLADEELRTRLRDDPSAVPDAVEELLRCYPSSNDGLLRTATVDVVLSGTTIHAGEPVLALVSAASRDPEVFPEPDRVVLERDGHRDIAFGAGRHACPAADLARTELGVGLGALLRAFPDVRLAVAADEVRHDASLIPLGIPALPVIPGPRADRAPLNRQENSWVTHG